MSLLKSNDEINIERTLRKSEERFRQVVESAPSAVVMAGSAGLNAQTEKLFGYPPDELPGPPIEALVPERFRHNHPRLRMLFFPDPKSRPMGAGRDLYGLKKDGSEFPIEIGLNPIETGERDMMLSAIVSNSHAVLSISNNGQGIPEDLDLTNNKTLGLRSVHLLTDQSGGERTTHRANPAAFFLRFPILRRA